MADELNLEQKLRAANKIAKSIEEAKSDKDQKVGERKAELSGLKNRFGLSDLKEAKARIANIGNKLVRANRKIDKMFDELNKKYEF